MDFDFYGQFSKYSSTDLLEIIRLPEQYQPEALAAGAVAGVAALAAIIYLWMG